MTEPSVNSSNPFLLAGRFLLDSDRSALEKPSLIEERWERAGSWLVVWGLFIGIAYAVVFRVAWKLFGEYERLRLTPVVVVLAFDLLGAGYWLIASIIHTGPSQFTKPAVLNPRLVLLLVMVVLLKFAFLLSMPIGARPYPVSWREHLLWIYPRVLYRPLVLMPLWGRWAMMLTLCIGRVRSTPQRHSAEAGSEPVEHNSSPLVRLAGGISLRAVLLGWLGCMALTVFFYSPTLGHLGHGLVISLAVLLGSYLAAFALAQRWRGQNLVTIHQVSLAAELVFLAFTLPISSSIYMY